MSNKICLYLFYDSLVFAKSASLSGCYVQANQSLVLLVVKNSPDRRKNYLLSYFFLLRISFGRNISSMFTGRIEKATECMYVLL